jgi:hypothetical protein
MDVSDVRLAPQPGWLAAVWPTAFQSIGVDSFDVLFTCVLSRVSCREVTRIATAPTAGQKSPTAGETTRQPTAKDRQIRRQAEEIAKQQQQIADAEKQIADLERQLALRKQNSKLRSTSAKMCCRSCGRTVWAVMGPRNRSADCDSTGKARSSTAVV